MAERPLHAAAKRLGTVWQQAKAKQRVQRPAFDANVLLHTRGVGQISQARPARSGTRRDGAQSPYLPEAPRSCRTERACRGEWVPSERAAELGLR